MRIIRAAFADKRLLLRAAERLQSRLAGPHALASQVTGWLVATQARLGMTGAARAFIAGLGDEQASGCCRPA